MSLGEYRRAIRDALRVAMAWPAGNADDGRAQGAPEWTLLRRLLVFRRMLAVRRAAPLSAELLSRRGRLTQEIVAMLVEGGDSWDTSHIGSLFLERMQRDSDSIVASLAASEHAIGRTARGDEREYDIAWSTDPEVVMRELLNPRSTVSVFEPASGYRLRVGRNCLGRYRA